MVVGGMVVGGIVGDGDVVVGVDPVEPIVVGVVSDIVYGISLDLHLPLATPSK